jgi:ketosteroid isomerase-like protein
MKTPGEESCGPLPKEAKLYLKKLVNRDLTKIQRNTDTIHGHFQKLEKGKVEKENFNTFVSELLRENFECIQDISNMNIAFPTLFTKDQVTVLGDLKKLTIKLNLEFPNVEKFTEYENGQIGGAAAILQQQWAS